MKKKPVGRPTKKGAVKSGELKKGLKRYSFIVDERLLISVKQVAKQQGVTMKDFMNKLLKASVRKLTTTKPIQNDSKQQVSKEYSKQQVSKKDEDKLLAIMANLKKD